jgi:hypothetical protein
MRFTFTHSHAFPGGRVAVADDGGEGYRCPVEFADGVAVLGPWRREGEGIVLDVPVYATARGSRIEARHWRVRRGSDGVWRTEPASGA